MDKVFVGNKCDICTGCGLCAGVENKVDVITWHLPYFACNKDIEKVLSKRKRECGERLVAVDIGTTTIAMQLFDTSGQVVDEFSQLNPQRKYGADVISRIEACRQKDKLLEMQQLVTDVVKKGLSQFKTKIQDGEKLFAVIGANTTMRYLLCGYQPDELGKAPFTVSYSDDDFLIIDGVECIVLSGFSAFVGGDLRAGMYAVNLHRTEDITLLIDLGTNGEMLLGNRQRIVGCATAAGPAFEGGPNMGSWGTDIIGAVATLLDKGLVDATGLLADKYFDTGITVGNVYITQASIRAIQLAKAAIRVGIDALIEKLGITYSDIKNVYLAGGFGYYLDPVDSVKIGLLPSELLEKTASAGNTSLQGAYIYGVKKMLEEKGEADKELLPLMGVECINLAEIDDFEDKYIQNIELR